jgi:hypothetical protein
MVVAEIARSQGTSIDGARHSVVADARLAEAEKERGLAANGEDPWAMTTALARADLESIWRSAGEEGEVRLFEREKLRVIHAVVRRVGGQPGSRMRDIAAAIRANVLAGRTAEDFETNAGPLVRQYPGILVERLPPFDATGATDEGAGGFDADFVAAAYELGQAGDTSEVAETRFGWHIIRLLERIRPDLSEPPPPALRDAVVEMRARQGVRAALKRQRAQVRVQLSTGAEARMAEAVVGLL